MKYVLALLLLAVLAGGYVLYERTGGKEGKERVFLYYYSEAKDKDASGNIQCSRAGLVPVERFLPRAEDRKTLIEEAVKLLVRGELSEAEKAQGISTEYPLPGLSLSDAELENGTLTLLFEDPSNRSVGGSCRVGILWFQIEATARQFEEVRSVKFAPEELFQP
ncbi:MAG: hypothetical protein Q8Q36_03110 [bacterium]|nr:hypothetical protein [bacterium]